MMEKLCLILSVAGSTNAATFQMKGVDSTIRMGNTFMQLFTEADLTPGFEAIIDNVDFHVNVPEMHTVLLNGMPSTCAGNWGRAPCVPFQAPANYPAKFFCGWQDANGERPEEVTGPYKPTLRFMEHNGETLGKEATLSCMGPSSMPNVDHAIELTVYFGSGDSRIALKHTGVGVDTRTINALKTNAPTSAPTAAPTEAPTAAPTAAPTPAPTPKPWPCRDTNGNNICRHRNWLFVNEPANYYTAKKYCEDRKGDLISLHNMGDQHAAQEMADRGGNGNLWTGVNDINAEGQWRNPDGSHPYTNWGPGEPNNSNNEDCVHIRGDTLLNDHQCGSPGDPSSGHHTYFACEFAPEDSAIWRT